MRKLSPKLRVWLEEYNNLMTKLKESGFKQTPTNAREGLANLTRSLVTDRPQVAWIQDDLVAGEDFEVPVRIFHPQPDSPLPVLLHFHGGGHMAGSISVYDTICRKIALATNHIVVSSDYRRSPECPYPAGISDAVSVAKNVYNTLNRRELRYIPQLSLIGDSAGGAICATVSHMLQQDDAVNIEQQILIYPSLDYTMGTKSITQNGQGYLLHKEKIEWFFDNYFRNNENRKKAAPLYMEFSHRLPRSLVITAEFCPLRDEGFRYVEKLIDAGVSAQHLHFDDMIHAFMNMEDIAKEQCAKLYREISKFLHQK